jgi:hypothetical protein
MPQPLYPQERTPVPNEQEAGGLQSQSGHFEEEENLLPLLGFKPQTVQPIDSHSSDCATLAPDIILGKHNEIRLSGPTYIEVDVTRNVCA